MWIGILSQSRNPKNDVDSSVHIMKENITQLSCEVVWAFEERELTRLIWRTIWKTMKKFLRFIGEGHCDATRHVSMDIDGTFRTTKTVGMQTWVLSEINVYVNVCAILFLFTKSWICAGTVFYYRYVEVGFHLSSWSSGWPPCQILWFKRYPCQEFSWLVAATYVCLCKNCNDQWYVWISNFEYILQTVSARQPTGDAYAVC